jgi:hypothetical protein
MIHQREKRRKKRKEVERQRKEKKKRRERERDCEITDLTNDSNNIVFDTPKYTTAIFYMPCILPSLAQNCIINFEVQYS